MRRRELTLCLDILRGGNHGVTNLAWNIGGCHSNVGGSIRFICYASVFGTMSVCSAILHACMQASARPVTHICAWP